MSRIVLVVDDSHLVLDIAATMLENLGCEVVTASNAKEALAKLSTDPRIEVLISDINMPGMDGRELAETAMRMHKGLKTILISGRLYDCGFPLLRKPFSQEDLKQSMARSTGLC